MTELPFTDLQLHIMGILWEHPDSTVIQVQDALRPERKLALATVATLLRRLEEKRAVTHRVIGRQFFYSARIGKPTARRSFTRELGKSTRRLFGGDVAALVNHLLDKNDVTREDLARVRQMIEEKEKQLPARKRGGKS